MTRFIAGIPSASLIALGAGLAFLGCGLCLVWAGLKKRSTKLISVGVAMVGLLAVTLGAELWFESGLELNPRVNVREASGVWSNGRETLRLRNDGRFDYSSDTEGMKGRWSCDDWNLKLDAEGGEGGDDFVVSMRFIRLKGRLGIVPGDTVSPGIEELLNALRKTKP